MINEWASEVLLPIGVPNDYDLDVDWPVVLPEFPDDEDDAEEDEDDDI